MNFKEAQQLVKDKAFAKYHFTAAHLLTKLVSSTYSKTDVDRDIQTVPVTRTVECVQKWLRGISVRQLRKILARVEEVTVVKRAPGRITFMLNLESLKNHETTAASAKRTMKERNRDRAVKARKQRAEQRQANRLTDAAHVMRENRGRFFSSILRPHRVLNSAMVAV